MDKTILKQSSIGLIPFDWEVKRLGDIGVFSKGKGILKAQVLESGLPCIRYGEIYTTHNFIIKEFKSYISEEVASESQEISKGDILFAGSGETIDDIGKAVVYIGNEKAYAGGDTIIFKPLKDNSETISYILELDSSIKQKRTFGQGNSVVHIYPSELKKLKIPLPPFPEQQKIASILTTWDNAIDNCKLIIEQLKVRNKGLIRKLIVDNGEWKKVELGNVLDYEQPTPYLTNNILNDPTLTPVLTANKSFILGYTNDNFGINKNTPTIIFDDFTTASRYIHFDFKIKSSAIKILKAKKGYNLKFAFYSLQLIQTNISSHKRRWISEFEDKVIKVPSLEIQNKLVAVLENSDEELNQYQQKLEALQLQKKGLMQQLLIGKTRVKI